MVLMLVVGFVLLVLWFRFTKTLVAEKSVMDCDCQWDVLVTANEHIFHHTCTGHTHTFLSSCSRVCAMKKGLFLGSTSISPLVALPLDALSWNCVPMLSQTRARISALCVQERRDSDTLIPASTVSFLDSCAREVISPTTTEPVESLFSEPSSQMRTFNSDTPDLEFCRWPMPDQTPMDLSSSCVPPKHLGSMESTSSLDRSSMVWTLCEISKKSDLHLEVPELAS